MSVRHFLTLLDVSSAELLGIVQRAMALKRDPALALTMERRTLGLIFDKASTRTRVAFEVAMTQMGGASIFLANADTQLGRGEPIEDSARVLSRMVDCVAIRTFEHSRIERFAEHSRVPVINALSDSFHPCQLLADVQTYMEHRGSLTGKTVAWIGDGNNMCQSYINAACAIDFELRIACPVGFEPDAALLASNQDRVQLLRDPQLAVKDADLVVTDVFASMGQEHQQAERLTQFKPYQVNTALMARAKSDALFMHCLPAHRGEEVSAELLEATDAVIWDEAENRMHSQKALLEFLLSQ